MANLFTINILAPDKEFLSCPVEHVIFDTPAGRMGMMAGHQPTVAAVAEGTIDIYMDGEWKTAAVGQGFVEIGANMAEFFVDTVEWAEDIDTARAIEALRRAELRMHSELSYVEFLRSQAAMARAMARIKASKRRPGSSG